MKIVYTEENQLKQLTFRAVNVNQFFVCDVGLLWQKVNQTSANQIADRDGNLFADTSDSWDESDTIRKIIDNVYKIEF